MKKRILFYVHFNKDNGLDKYVVYQLQKMKPIFQTVVFITNSKISAQDKIRLDGLYNIFIQRDNQGFDFGAWRDSMINFGWEKIDKYNELTLMNDTCLGPIGDFSKVYDEMISRKVDFFGMTNYIASSGMVRDAEGNFIVAPEHIQSYYMTFKKNVFSSSEFRDFFANIKSEKKVQNVTANYEIRLTKTLADAGFSYDTLHNAVKFWGKKEISFRDIDEDNYKNLSKYDPSYTYLRPLWLLQHPKNYPFIKTKALGFISVEEITDLREFIIKETDYPVSLFDSYLAKNFLNILKNRDDALKSIQNSKSYKIGLNITKPWRILRAYLLKKREEWK